MKKSSIVIIIGLLIVVTILLGTNNNKMYQKQVRFNTSDEVIEQLKTKTLIAVDENGSLSETNDLKECLSKRKRLTYSDFNFEKIDIEKIENLNEKQKAAILDNYNSLRNEFTKRSEITKEEPIRLDINAYSSYYQNNKKILSDPQKMKLDLVLIDEGEGLVIDYIMEYTRNEEDGNEDA
ncbi:MULTISPECIES: hypothetical protein [unclassified Clostridium]|uniref:hypothetical protein n=1 Tax=unclassified Clostridium TaxID=2614128 RepID=UPI0002983E74|nr:MULTISPECIES: hypothetical protein [unclassified Clostridium]EKQ56399.1 MAG: hypothetical protein A370_01991 [Clostridium sp. Maddingley MBC34-26]